MSRSHLLAGAAALALGLALSPASHAAVIQVGAPQPLSATPISFTLGTGTFSFTLDAAGVGNGPQSFVRTNSAGGVATIFGGVADFGAGAAIDGNYNFVSYVTPTSIPNSSAVDYIGFSYVGTDGRHYGFAEVFGNTFLGYAYESSPNTTIVTQDISAPPQSVPEPASAALLIGGLAMVGAACRKKRNNHRELAA